MTPRELIAAFDAVAEAPDGVARLREFILQLAVRGTLVPQDPTDEPAGVLLKRIDAEKARLVQARDISKPQALPESIEEPEFKIPPSWQWTHLARLVPWDLTDGDWVESKDQHPAGAVRLTQLADVGVGTFLNKSDRYLTTEAAERLRCTTLEPGDVLIARLPRPLGRACIFPGLQQPAVTVVDVAIARCKGPSVAPQFLVHLLNSPLVAEQAEALAAGTTRKRISTGNLRRVTVPLPPIAEQQRIVARVDELMGLIERFEAARTRRNRTRAAARDSVLEALREARATKELEAAWRRCSGRMQDLLCDPGDISPMRQAVLQLAVHGRLVDQDPTDEPSHLLLKRIDAEKMRLVRAKCIGKPHALPELTAETRFQVPSSWVWTHLARLVPWDLTDGDWVESKDQDPSGAVRLTQLADVGIGAFLDKSDRYLAADTADRLRCTFLEPGDVLIARLPRPLGRACVLPSLAQPAVTVVDVAIARCKGPSIAPQFLVHLLNSPLAAEQVEALAAGTTRKRISTGNLRRITVPLPPLAEQHRIVVRVDELMDLLDHLEARLAAARTAQAAFAAAAVRNFDS